MNLTVAKEKLAPSYLRILCVAISGPNEFNCNIRFNRGSFWTIQVSFLCTPEPTVFYLTTTASTFAEFSNFET